VLDMAANTPDLAKLFSSQIAPTLAEYGLEMPSIYIENISLPPKVEEALDKRTSIGLSGNLDQFMKYSAAEAMGVAAANPGGGMGAGLGMGMGMGMAQQMAGQSGPWGARPVQAQAQAPAAMVPPPPPIEKVWHVAENGETKGPFSRAALGRMAGHGGLTRASLVWTAGQDGWKKANDIAELAQLFTVLPPPPPPPPGA